MRGAGAGGVGRRAGWRWTRSCWPGGGWRCRAGTRPGTTRRAPPDRAQQHQVAAEDSPGGRLVDDPGDGPAAEHGQHDVARLGEHRLLLALRERPGGRGPGQHVVVGEHGHACVAAVPAGAHHQRARARQFADGGQRQPPRRGGRHGLRGRRRQLGGQPQRLVEPRPYVGQPAGAAGVRRGRQPAGGGKVDVVVEEFDDRHRAGQAGPFLDAPVPVEGAPGVEHGLPHPGPVGSAAPLGGEPPGVDEQHLRLRGRPVGPAQHPQVQRHAVRGRRPGGQRDDGAQRAPAQQVGPDAPAGAAGRHRGRHQQHGGAAVPEPGERVLHPGQLGLGAGGGSRTPSAGRRRGRRGPSCAR